MNKDWLYNEYVALNKSTIVDGVISSHPELKIENPEDKEKLYQLCINDKDFLDLNNLITLCKNCHQHKVHGKKIISSQASENNTEEGSETIQ